MKKIFSAGLLTVAATVGMTAGAMAQTAVETHTTVQTNSAQTGLSGQVQASTWPADAEVKTITLEPGHGQFSIDSLALGDTVVINLVNPTANPLRFETVQRIGQEYSWIVAPHSQQSVSFVYTHPFSDEVKFLVYQEPSNAIAQINSLRTQQTASSSQIQTMPQSGVSSMGATADTSVQSQQTNVYESRSTVRGYW